VPSPATLPLFDDASQPSGPVLQAAFDAWLTDARAERALQQPGSIALYQRMWDVFVQWCLGQTPAVSLDSLRQDDLQQFHTARYGLKSADLSLTPRYTLRLMRLIDRVLRHHAAQQDTLPNTAAADWIAAHPEVRYADAAHADPLAEYLDVKEARTLIAYLSAARPRPGVNPAALAAMSWQELRNRSSVALQLGAGLTPGDVRNLTLESPVHEGGRVRQRPWKLRVPGDGNSRPRETPIAPWAAELLQHWLQVRASTGLQGPYLYPSTRTGKQWSENSQYKSARQVLEDAGVDSREGGSFRLRHTFAMRQLRRGTPPLQVANWLGIEPEKMKRYDRVLPMAVDVV